jgi:hypothetical protein
VSAIRIDDYISDNSISKVKLIKIDVEGAEFEVIKGMKSLLLRDKPLIVMEMNSEAQEAIGLSISYIKEQMSELFGYKCYKILADGRTEESPINEKYYVENVVFM